MSDRPAPPKGGGIKKRNYDPGYNSLATRCEAAEAEVERLRAQYDLLAQAVNESGDCTPECGYDHADNCPTAHADVRMREMQAEIAALRGKLVPTAWALRSYDGDMFDCALWFRHEKPAQSRSGHWIRVAVVPVEESCPKCHDKFTCQVESCGCPCHPALSLGALDD